MGFYGKLAGTLIFAALAHRAEAVPTIALSNAAVMLHGSTTMRTPYAEQQQMTPLLTHGAQVLAYHGAELADGAHYLNSLSAERARASAPAAATMPGEYSAPFLFLLAAGLIVLAGGGHRTYSDQFVH